MLYKKLDFDANKTKNHLALWQSYAYLIEYLSMLLKIT